MTWDPPREAMCVSRCLDCLGHQKYSGRRIDEVMPSAECMAFGLRPPFLKDGFGAKACDCRRGRRENDCCLSGEALEINIETWWYHSAAQN